MIHILFKVMQLIQLGVLIAAVSAVSYEYYKLYTTDMKNDSEKED